MSATPRPWGKADFEAPQGWRVTDAKNWPIGYFAKRDDRDLCQTAVNAVHALDFEDADEMLAAFSFCPVCHDGAETLFNPATQTCGSCGYSQMRGGALDSVARRLGFLDANPEEILEAVRTLVNICRRLPREWETPEAWKELESALTPFPEEVKDV